MAAKPKAENSKSECERRITQSSAQGEDSRAIRFLTREELAEVLQISIRTVDAMVAAGDIPCVRLRGAIVRFYLPDVVRHLTATALTRKRARSARLRVES